MKIDPIWQRQRQPRVHFTLYLEEEDERRRVEAEKAEKAARAEAARAEAARAEAIRKAEEAARKLEAARNQTRIYEILAKIGAQMDHRKSRMSNVIKHFDCSAAVLKHEELYQGLVRAGVALTPEDFELLTWCFDPGRTGSIGIVPFTQALKTAELKAREEISMRHLLDTGRFLPKLAPRPNSGRYDWSPRVKSTCTESTTSLPKISDSFHRASSGVNWEIVREASNFRERPLGQTIASKKPCLRKQELPLHEHRFKQIIVTTRFGNAAPTGVSEGLLAAGATCETAQRFRR